MKREENPEQWLKDPLEELKLPDEASSGSWSLHSQNVKKGEQLLVVDFREAFLAGREQVNAHAPKPFKIHYLKEDGSIVMSSIPREYRQMEAAVTSLRGNVLIGGLGLGLVATLASKRRTVKRITIVEKEADVINLVGPSIKRVPKVEGVFLGDLFYYLKKTNRQFDSAFFDIWTGTSENDWVECVVPLRRLSAKIGIMPSRIVCWMEDVMRGQVTRALLGCMAVKEYDNWWPHKVFLMGIKDLGIRIPVEPADMHHQPDDLSRLEATRKMMHNEYILSQDSNIKVLISNYLTNIGHYVWEERWGKYWDQLKPKKKEENI